MPQENEEAEEQTVEQTSAEAEIFEKPPEEQAETPAPPESKPAGEKPKREWDKELQRIQQEVGNKLRPFKDEFSRELNARDERIRQLQEKIEAISAKATPKLKDELESLAEQAGQPIDPDATVPVLAKRLHELQQQVQEQLRGVEERVAGVAQQTHEAQMLAYERRWKSQFSQVNPELADVADDAFTRFQVEYSEIVGDGKGFSREAIDRVAQGVYARVLEQVKTAKTPEAKASSKVSKGATIVPTGSRKAVGTRRDDTDDTPDFFVAPE